LTTDGRASDGGSAGIGRPCRDGDANQGCNVHRANPEGSVDLPGPISVGIWVGVALGAWVALTIIWPRARPPRNR
jgi:hypothetical protein